MEFPDELDDPLEDEPPSTDVASTVDEDSPVTEETSTLDADCVSPDTAFNTPDAAEAARLPIVPPFVMFASYEQVPHCGAMINWLFVSEA